MCDSQSSTILGEMVKAARKSDEAGVQKLLQLVAEDEKYSSEFRKGIMSLAGEEEAQELLQLATKGDVYLSEFCNKIVSLAERD